MDFALWQATRFLHGCSMMVGLPGAVGLVNVSDMLRRTLTFKENGNLLYYLYEMNHAAIAPWRAAAEAANFFWKNPVNPFAQTYMGRSMAASLDLFERVTRRYGKPAFGIDYTVVAGDEVPVVEERLLDKTFCSLLHFS
ncbi:MAG TPA: hypothetical protein VL101_04200, partial [Nordella sp.]|nr:hypothetical protein [Nordella sp.]